jgi:hypothetical protein
MLSPTQLLAMLSHEQARLSYPAGTAYSFYDRATVICLVAGMLRRYLAEHQQVLDAALQVQVGRALHDAERELHWLALCGGDAEESDLLAAVSIAVSKAADAAGLLRTDISGVFSATPARAGGMLPPQTSVGVTR